MNFFDDAIRCSVKAGRSFEARDRAMEMARAPAASHLRRSFVQIAKLHNDSGMRLKRTARAYIQMSVAP